MVIIKLWTLSDDMDNKAFDRDEGNVVNNNKQMQVIKPVKPMNDKDDISGHMGPSK